MGKKKKNAGKKGGNRFFRWIKSDLPDEEDKTSPVLLLGVNKISDSPSFVRRRSIDPYTTGSIRFFRPPKPKYIKNSQGDERLEKIRQDLITHKHKPDRYIPKPDDRIIELTEKRCLNLDCSRSCVCDKKRNSNRGSFSFQRPEQRQSSLCPSEPYEKTERKPDLSENEIEFKYKEHFQENQPSSSKQNSYNVTPKSTDRRHFLLSNLNERFRKTLSLDSRKIETNRTPLSLPQETRPKSLVNTGNICVANFKTDFLVQNFDKGAQPKKKRKSFFSLEGFFDSKKSDTSSVDDYCSSKYKRFELESDDSPLFRPEIRQQREKTPDLLNLPVIIDSVRKKQSDTKRQLDKLESHYYKSLNTRPIIDCIPRDATEPRPSGSGQNHLFIDEDDVEYIEPIRSNFTSQSTLILDKNHQGKPDSILTINTDDTDIKLPSSVSPRSNDVRPENDLDSIGAYEIEVKESDLLKNNNRLTVKVMDKSVDSIGSCSLDVDASTDFSDTTSGSLNILTPSSTGSRIRDFTSRIHERTHGTPTITPDDATPTPRRPDRPSDHQLKPKDAASHRSRNLHKKRDELKKPSYLHLACSVNGYTNLTSYDSKLRQDLNRSREASPIRPITHYQYRTESNSLLVPVPVAANKLLVPLASNDTVLTNKAPRALPDPCLGPLHVYMAEENKQLKKDFFGPNMATTTRPYISTESKNFATSMLHKDEVDNAKEITFKSSYSETNFLKTISASKEINHQRISSESYTISSNGVSKHVEIMKENGEQLTSPMKSFIQQRVERLYGPGALAQGFLMQKRKERKSFTEDEKVLSEKSLNHQTYVSTQKSTEAEPQTYSGGSGADTSVSLPVLRHLRPEFRAQLPIVSPKRSPRAESFHIPVKTEAFPEPCDVTNGVSGLHLDDSRAKNGSLSVHSNSSDCVNSSSENDKSFPFNSSSQTDKSACSVKTVKPVVNGKEVCVKEGSNGEVVKDAYYFLELKRLETERLIELAVSAEKQLEELQDQDVSEEIQGLLRAASGKARLLATQKMQQFEGLCYNNINERADEPFPTTVEDLQGFWDMVCLQVRSVDALHRQLAALKANNWREPPPPQQPCSASSSPAPRRSRPAAPPANERARLAAEKRDGERKAMLEHRRRVARERMLAARAAVPGTSHEEDTQMGIEGSQEVEIFVGKSAKPSKVAPRGDCMSNTHSDDSFQS